MLALVAQERPDLVIVDIRMPPTHSNEGLDAARAIRAESPETGILVLSAHVEVEHAMELLSSDRAIGYLLKSRVTDVGDFLYGEKGSDRIVGDNGTAAGYPLDLAGDVPGAGGGDVIFGGPDNDFAYGGDGLFDPGAVQDGPGPSPICFGDDTLDGGAGDDRLFGGSGNDFIDGGEDDPHPGLDAIPIDEPPASDPPANDILRGDAGADTIWGRRGDDQIDGGHDADNLYGGNGDDSIDGGAGDDIVFGDYGVITQTDFTQRLTSTSAVTLIDSVNPASGGNDVISGNAGRDRILGGFGGDTISGGEDGDFILGDSGLIYVEPAGNRVTRVVSTEEGVGGADSIGGDAYNLDLSRRRSAAVKQALVTRYKIGENRLQTSGFGASRPKDRNDTMEGRARNRRVELVKG